MIFEIKVIFEDDNDKERTSKEDDKTITDPVVEDDGSPINRRR